VEIPPFPKPGSLEEALALQKALVGKVVVAGSLEGVRRIAALDASHRRGKPLLAVAVLYDLERGPLFVGKGAVPEEELFPYVPGFLSFREAPAYLLALKALPEAPEALLVDGQGIAHPRAWASPATWGSTWTFPAWAWPRASSMAARKALYPRKGAAPSASSPPRAGPSATFTVAGPGRDPFTSPPGTGWASRKP
jgi:hypothetical protein